jgi:ribosomal-protein-alanine N-acetyltransferase
MEDLPFWLETPRLVLRPIASEDIDSLHQLWVHPEVRRFLCDDEIVPKEQIVAIVEESGNLFHAENFGLWGVFPQQRNDLIGFCGFWYFHTPPEQELIYGISPDCWGRGFATEAAKAVMHYGFEVLGFDRISASADAPNHASIRVMQKLGMNVAKRTTTGKSDLVFYTLSRKDFSSL